MWSGEDAILSMMGVVGTSALWIQLGQVFTRVLTHILGSAAGNIARLQCTATSTWLFPNSPSPKKGAVTAITPNCIMHSTRGEADAEKKLRWILVSLSAKWTWAKLFIPLCSHYPIISNRLFRIGRPPVSLLSDIYICGGPVDDCCSVPRAVSLRQLRTKWAPPSVRRAQRHSRPTWNADKQTTHLSFINKTKQQQNNHQASR